MTPGRGIVVAIGLVLGGCSREQGATPGAPSDANVPGVIMAVDLDPLSESIRNRIVEARQAVRRSPDDAAVVGELGMLYLVNEFIGEAAICFERAADLEPEALRWPYYAGLTYSELEDTAAALDAYERAVNIDATYVPAWVELGGILLEQDAARAEAAYRRALELNEGVAPAHAGLGRCARIQGRREEAVGHFTRAVAIDPQLSEAQYELAMLLRSEGLLDEADRHLQLFQRGGGRAGSRMADPLRAELSRTVEGAHTMGGGTLKAVARSGGDGQALARLEQAVELDPDNTAVRSNLGVAYLRQGRFDDAAVQFEAILERHPHYVEERVRLAAARAGQGRIAEAEALFREALSRQPDSGFILHRFGVFLERQGRIDEALVMLRRAVEVQPGRGTYRFALGRLLARQGLDPEAIEHLEVAVELMPGNAEARSLLETVRDRSVG